MKHTQIFLIAVLLLARLAALPAADSQPSAELRDYAVWSADPNQVLERTCFQTGGAWRNEANLRSDVAIVYVVGTSLPARIQTWRDRGYRIHVMTGVSWGNYQDYLYGRFDGVNHEDEAQTERDGKKISHGGDVYYMCPGTNFGKFLCVGVQLRDASNLHERGRGYSEGKHAAQFQLYFTLQNLNRQSLGYGEEYVWFGVPFYDDRYPVISPSYMRDGTGKEDERKGEKLGTGRFINSVGTKPFAEHGLVPGEWLNIRTNILPLMVEALERAWSRGFCKSSTNLADYKIGSMNIGWEVPGLSAVSAQFKDLSLLATGPKAEK